MKLSILMITYKQEPFVAQAIASVLMQRTNFDFELVIGDDKSPDGTGQIAREFARQHPDRIRFLEREANLGMHRNFYDTFAQCRGEYVAILEGDDYWTDPEKLQIQADALDAHPNWAICFHPAAVLEDGQTTPTRELPPPGERRPIYGLADILRGNMIQTPTVMFRNHLFDEFPGWLIDLPMLDWPVHALNARKGDIGFIDRTMAVYRMHGGGIWSMKSMRTKREATQKLYALFAQHVAPEHAAMLRQRASIVAGQLAGEYAREGEYAAARKQFAQYLRHGGWREPGQRRMIPALIYQCYLRRFWPL
jgi:glycosyltransferase involved in cell wall biosynthesis